MRLHTSSTDRLQGPLCNGHHLRGHAFVDIIHSLRANAMHQSLFVSTAEPLRICSKSPEEHAKHVEAVLSALEQHHLYAKASKCHFGMVVQDFLGHTISGAGIKDNTRKVKAILEWPEPSDAHQLKCFLGLAGFHRRFVNKIFHLAAPLTNITGAKATWRWSEVEAKAFAELKQALITSQNWQHLTPPTPLSSTQTHPNLPWALRYSKCGPGG